VTADEQFIPSPKHHRPPWSWPRGGIQLLVDGEAQQLTQRIRQKVADIQSAGGERTVEMQDFDDWLGFRFAAPLRRDVAAGPAFGKSATAIGVATIGAGLASSALATASADWATVTVAALGIVVGGPRRYQPDLAAVSAFSCSLSSGLRATSGGLGFPQRSWPLRAR
jgi:hypothetical protein